MTRYMAGAMGEGVILPERYWGFYDGLAKQHGVSVPDVMAEVLRQYAALDPAVRRRALTPKRDRMAQHADTLVRLSGAGWSDNRIAQHLGLAQSSVSRYRRNVLGIESPGTPGRPKGS